MAGKIERKVFISLVLMGSSIMGGWITVIVIFAIFDSTYFAMLIGSIVTILLYISNGNRFTSITIFHDTHIEIGKSNDPLSLNTYSYGYNNPIKYWDPTGHIVTKWDEHNLSDDQIRLIDKATNDWIKANKSGDEKSKKAAHARAEAVRNSVRTASEIIYCFLFKRQKILFYYYM